MVAAMEVPCPTMTSAYGILDIKDDMGSVVSVKGMVEKKPAQGSAPSNLAVIGRYILTPRDHGQPDQDQVRCGGGGAILGTDAIAQENLAVGQRVWLTVSGASGSIADRRPVFFCRPPWPSPGSREDLRDEFSGYLSGPDVVAQRRRIRACAVDMTEGLRQAGPIWLDVRGWSAVSDGRSDRDRPGGRTGLSRTPPRHRRPDGGALPVASTRVTLCWTARAVRALRVSEGKDTASGAG